MISLIWRSTILTLLFTALLCGAYPLLVTVAGQTLFADKANGSLITRAGKIVGSKLIAQSFASAKYFQSRPSAAGDKGYDAQNSSGSNLGPTSKKLIDGVAANIKSFLEANPSVAKGQVPVDIVTASASGLDPHISPEAALAQVNRVAKARGVDAEQIKSLIAAHTQYPWLGLLGNAAVNVLTLNLALDQQIPQSAENLTNAH